MYIIEYKFEQHKPKGINTIKINIITFINKTIKNNSITMVKIQKLPSGQLVITIPKRIAEYEGLEKGTELEFKKHKDGFVLERKRGKNG